MRSPRPVLSIVVPARDNHPLTCRCLESVILSASGVPTEIIVVDDGSEVPVRTALSSLKSHLAILRHPESRGFAAAVNSGLARSRGDAILLLNNDTEPAPGAIPRLLDALDRDPELGIGGAELYYPDGTPQWSGGRRPTLLWLFALASGIPRGLRRLPGYRRLRPMHRRPRRTDWVTGAAMIVRRQVWRDIGPLDETIGAYAQDLDYCLRAGERGWGIEVVHDARVLHHHGATMTSDLPDGASTHIGQLWTSLLSWAHKSSGPAGLARARFALCLGGRLRLTLLGLEALLRSTGAKPQVNLRRDSSRAALSMARSFRPLGPPPKDRDRGQESEEGRASERRPPGAGGRGVRVVRSLP